MNEQGPVKLAGGCGCENTQFRWKGELMIMESHGHGCDYVFPWYNTTEQGDCTYFRIRSMSTGIIIANVSESIDHSFFSAVVDYSRPDGERLWVFGPAHARQNKKHPGPCDGSGNITGCYIGAWSSTDLVHWSPVAKALELPDHHAAFNTDVAIVPTSSLGVKLGILPAHQAVMTLLVGRNDDTVPRNSLGGFAINVGKDGDLSENWVLLPSNFSVSGATIPHQLNMGAPSLRFDDEEGYYYKIGGGSITAGPVRSQSLAAGSWEISPRAPMAIPAAVAAKAGLRPQDSALHREGFFTKVWEKADTKSLALAEAWIANVSAWNWGVTDPDLCCSDGKAPVRGVQNLNASF